MMICSLADFALTQEMVLGIPYTTNFEQDVYKAGPQNWDFDFDDHKIYFANNGGLLMYNGINWQVQGTVKNTVMRCVNSAPDGKIYIGTQNEIGYFESSDNGELSYVDLSDSLGQEINLTEIWDIELFGDTLYFGAEKNLFQYINGKTKIFNQNSNLTDISKIDQSLWIHPINDGIFTIENGKKSFVKNSEIFKGKNIISFEKAYQNQIYIVTEKHGIFIYDGHDFKTFESNANSYLKAKRISSSLYHPDYGLFLGTYLGGIVKIDSGGKTTLALSKKNGLQNNTINCLGLTPNGVLWTGTNHGIDEIDISSSFKKFFPDLELEGAVYDFEEWNNTLFFATSNGLYYIQKQDYYNPLSDIKFKLVAGTEGQTWGTDVIDGQLFCAHHDGPKVIRKNMTSSSILENVGCWKFIEIDKNIIAIGTYEGVYIYRKTNDNRFELLNKVTDFAESARIMLKDQFDNLWISHPYKNVYKVNFANGYRSSTISRYTAKDGFVTNDQNYISKINGRCFLTNPSGIYVYNEKTDAFESDQILNQFVEKGIPVHRIKQEGDKIWLISQANTSCLRPKPGNEMEYEQQVYDDLSLSKYIGGFEDLFSINNNTLLISTDNGMIEYGLNRESYQPSVQIKSVSLSSPKDSTLFGGFEMNNEISLEPVQNAIHFEFGSNYPQSNSSELYSYKLENVDQEWSSWNNSTNKDYTNLNHGEYLFEVKSKSISGIESEIASFGFEIQTPWYKSIIAYVLYFLLFCGLLFLMFSKQRQAYEENADQLIQEKEEKEKELEIVKEEKLQSEIRLKNMELANSTLHLLQKNQTLKTLKDKFDELNKYDPNPVLKKELNNILSVFRSDLRQEEDWDKFSFYFDQVHQDFIKKLKENYPQLTSNDHKLCAYLKMNLNTKEIAPLLGISVRGVEIGRYRLRKKLELDRTINLNDFFNKI